ncbi:hydroxymethylglutaryl-CoA lyase [Alkalihalobacterium chitinilyticum]|uniref:Hydroxymethylglutaryl-CoA lyase n=1 Tax=Alkalihalobacterium chitinilyticum TaxID=2980103 RepID=A0ABT5VHP9_9BACI|nr:hydroxymethylglutaryl-CoA lyase [Alkalihalobacterium chitinilyticum]MDE5414939.1 hydroxymethylglutaryl-CoA lyase [Alkalihalobacterium chitinilyticum]
MKFPNNILLKEVGPRDGLQNEKSFISTEDKVEWINRLSDTGLSYIEITSFVHPKWIPALADAVDVVKKIKRKPGVTYAALVPNEKGLQRALEADIDEVSVFMSASETHNQKNINKTIDETFKVLRPVVQEAKANGKTTRGYVSTVFGCPYEQDVSIEDVIKVSEHLFEMGIDELSLGDTIGVGNPAQVQRILDELLTRFPASQLAMHFHDTRGTALANILASLDMGITKFDAAVAGLGGCPYAPGASGNVATEDLLYMLDEMGIETGVNQDRLLAAAQWIEEKVGRTLPSRNLQVAKAGCQTRA